MAKLNSIRNLKPEQIDAPEKYTYTPPVPVPKSLPEIGYPKELQAIKERGMIMNTLSNIAENTKTVKPDEERNIEVWHLVYRCAINQIFSKGLSIWNQRGDALKAEMQLAVIRADEAVEAYIKVRNSCPDPVFMATQKWHNEHSKNTNTKDNS